MRCQIKGILTRLALFFGLIALLVVHPSSHGALAADITLHEGSGQQRTVVLVTGPFESGDDRRFIDVSLRADDPVIVLASGGGNLIAGLEMGRAIRLQRLETTVPPGEVCASACALAWLGGSSRHMLDGARIGFHAAFYLDDDGDPIETGMGNALVGAYLNTLGLSDEAVIYITQAAPQEMQWLSANDAQSVGIALQASPDGVAAAPLVQNPAAPAQTAAPASSTAPPTYRVRANVSSGYQNVRGGAGTMHTVVFRINALVGGITVNTCRRPDPGGGRFDWCEIEWQGQRGWLSSNGIELDR